MISIPKGSLFASLIIALLSPLQADPDEKRTDPVDDEWELLLREADELLAWSEDPLAELHPQPAQALTIWSTSIRAGGGYSNNFLKRADPVGSPYAQLEGDFYLNRQFAHSSFTALAFFEASHYTQTESAEREGIAFLHASQAFLKGARTISIEGEVFYGRQVYDASLLVTSPPDGDLFTQFRPQLAAEISLEVGNASLFEGRLAIERVEFEDSENDFWRPQLSASWTRVMSERSEVHLLLGAYGEWHDAQLPRTAEGLLLAETDPLTVGGLRIESGFGWSRPEWLNLRMHLKGGISREEADTGVYEDAWRYWGSLAGSCHLGGNRLRLYGRWQDTRYDHRFADLESPPVLRQISRTLTFELQRDLPRDLSLLLGVEWNVFDSRADQEAFTERRVRALLEWAY